MRAAPVDPRGTNYIGTATKARDLIARLTNIPEKHVERVDDNVIDNLPPDTRIRRIRPHGIAYWTRTAAIDTVQADGSRKSYFIKVTVTDAGKKSLEGEYASMILIHNATPDFCPRPIAVGDFASDSNAHFFLCEFLEMTDEPAELDTLPAKIAELHSKAISPNGRFGFGVPCNQGALSVTNAWTNSWEVLFTNMIKQIHVFELDVHGPDKELEKLYTDLLEKIIPRLLRPLETGGRSIEPRLVHGDLWDGNTANSVNDDLPLIFDGSSLYAHNEYELGAWNQPRHQIYKSYIREYQKHFPVSEPVEDAEDRLILYRIRFNLASSMCYLTSTRFRTLAMEDMRMLIEKYPNGYEGKEARKSET